MLPITGGVQTEDPSSNVAGSATVTPWIVLTVTASPNSVFPGGTSTITADLNHDNTGTPLTGGQLPDGIVTFSGDTLGSVNPTSAETINGVASTTFTAGTTTGDSNPAATVDATTIPTTININVGGADVSVIKSFQDSNLNTITTANLGDLVYSNIQVTNSGPSTATGVLISDPTPTGLTYANSLQHPDSGTFDPTTGWNIGTLENGATAILNIAYYVTGTGTITNTARATTTSTDPHNINNAWTTTLNIPDTTPPTVSSANRTNGATRHTNTINNNNNIQQTYNRQAAHTTTSQ